MQGSAGWEANSANTGEVRADAGTKRRLSTVAARLVLAREMWARDHNTYDYSAWENDELLTDTYDRYIAKADRAIREEMDARPQGASQEPVARG